MDVAPAMRPIYRGRIGSRLVRVLVDPASAYSFASERLLPIVTPTGRVCWFGPESVGLQVAFHLRWFGPGRIEAAAWPMDDADVVIGANVLDGRLLPRDVDGGERLLKLAGGRGGLAEPLGADQDADRLVERAGLVVDFGRRRRPGFVGDAAGPAAATELQPFLVNP